jgi:glycosyltransferase involved in cell wall biosynthesis
VHKPLGIIIPVYNEAENIELTLSFISRQIRTPHKIYLIYDFDADNTLPVARRLLKDGLPLELIKNRSQGVANAIKTGLRQAAEDYLLVTMADLSDDYTVVDRMVQLISNGYDIVCGSRYMAGGRQMGGPLLKKLLSRTAGMTLKLLTNLPTHDATNSFKMYRKSTIDHIEIESKNGFEIGMEIVIKAYFAGCKITEVACVWTDRQAGKSRFRLRKWIPKYLKWYFFALKKAFFEKSDYSML